MQEKTNSFLREEEKIKYLNLLQKKANDLNDEVAVIRGIRNSHLELEFIDPFMHVEELIEPFKARRRLIKDYDTTIAEYKERLADKGLLSNNNVITPDLAQKVNKDKLLDLFQEWTMDLYKEINKAQSELYSAQIELQVKAAEK